MKTVATFVGRLWLWLWISIAAWGSIGLAQSPPPFNVEVINDQTVKLVWPNSGQAFVLQESDSPSSSARWFGVPQTPVVEGANLAVTRSLASDWTRVFYRIRTKDVLAGLDYLMATQNSDGTWGSGKPTDLLTTTAAVEALSMFGVSDYAVNTGLSGLFGLPVRNNDDLSRKILALAGAEMNIDSLVPDLLDAQGAVVNSESALGFPGNGWGLSKGFGNSTIDTALALRAVVDAGFPGGLAVVKEPVPAGSSSPVHLFEVPSGATATLLKIRSVLGATLRFNLTTPGSGTLYVDVAPRTTTLNISPLPTTAGNWTLEVVNSSGVAGAYTAQVGFSDANGFDTFRVSNGFVYLGLAQNTDGGWGISAGEDSHLMITSEVVQTLSGAGALFVGPQALSGGSTWLLNHRNADGGFSHEPDSSNANETSLAVIALRMASPATSLSSSLAYLKAGQLPDGSWGGNPYATARAAHALFLPPVVSPIPDQTVAEPAPFAAINLDNYVSDPNYADTQLAWAANGQSVFSVSIANRVATITYPPGTRTTEVITFTATNPDGLSGSRSASFQVTAVDHVIVRGGNAVGSRVVSGAAADVERVAGVQWIPPALPAGVSYAVTGLAGISDTQLSLDYRITVGAATTPGIYGFQVDHDFYDSGNTPIPGPFTGDVFDISIQITP